MEETKARRAAEALLSEHKTGVQFKTLDPGTGLASMPDAYDIQDKYVDLLRAEHGAAIGYKVGLYVEDHADLLRDRSSDRRRRTGEAQASIRRHHPPRRLRAARPRIRDRGAHQVGHPGDSDDACGGRAAYRRAFVLPSRSWTIARRITANST